MVSLCHGHGKKNVSKSRVNDGWGNLFNERMESVKMEYS